jgi:lipopolysaccharide/colanic/teichoic acid biosynthesis glycosyltransferase
MLKRMFDIIVALIGLIVFSPLLVIIAVLIKLDSSGPVFYRALRAGQDGRLFRMYKFRTMVVDADKMGPALTYDRDPRITRVGARLRDARIDEIPQLINVLMGDMSMVGPRPEAPCYVEMYTPEQREVLRAKPGMTGPAQVVFRHEEEELTNVMDLDAEYMNVVLPPKLALDKRYIEEQSLVLDLKILFQTGWVLLADRLKASGKGAH